MRAKDIHPSRSAEHQQHTGKPSSIMFSSLFVVLLLISLVVRCLANATRPKAVLANILLKRWSSDRGSWTPERGCMTGAAHPHPL